jgi:hypothetical protein
MRADSPEGYEPVVEVFLVGRPEPVRLGGVATYRDPAFPWTVLVSDSDDATTGVSPDERVLFVDDGRVERIEISLELSDRPRTGFSYEVRDDALASGAE